MASQSLTRVRHYASRIAVLSYSGLAIVLTLIAAFLAAGYEQKFVLICSAAFCTLALLLAGAVWAAAVIAALLISNSGRHGHDDGDGNGSGKPDYHNDNTRHHAAADGSVPQGRRLSLSREDGQSSADQTENTRHPEENRGDRPGHFRAA